MSGAVQGMRICSVFCSVVLFVEITNDHDKTNQYNTNDMYKSFCHVNPLCMASSKRNIFMYKI